MSNRCLILTQILESRIIKVPIIGKKYFRNAARIKRHYYLLLHDWGVLKPVAFVAWLVTYRCNLKCSYCEASSGEAGPNELSFAEARQMIDDLKKSGVKRILLSGGEPLMRPDFMQLLDYICQSGISPGLISNGYHVESHWNELRKYPFFFYQSSLDGIPAFHDRIRGMEDSFVRALRGLELFSEIKTPVRIVQSVVHARNIDQLDAMLEYVRSSSATRWQLTPLAQVGRAANGELCLDYTGIQKVMAFIRKYQRTFPVDLCEANAYLACLNPTPLGYPFFCGAGLTRCSIMPDGEVLGCNQVYDNRYSEGNIKKRSFSDIWKNEFKRFRQKDFRQECRACSFLNQCQGGCWVEWCTRGTCYLQLDRNRD